ncbi:MAG: Fe-S protein assembly co-chaperone HscB [Gammaproteobacteria bacterium]
MPTNRCESHFELFGLLQSFELNLAKLDRVYRDLQRSVHPDRFSNASELERRLSIQQAARINGAYAVLKDPVSRGRYLLELHGHEFDDENSTTRSTEFLMEQMELREALADVRDSDNPMGTLNALMDRISDQLEESTQRLSTRLDQDETGQLAGPMDEAVDTVLEMKFYRRLQEDMLDLEAELDDDLA